MNLSYDNNLFCVEAPISDNELLRRAGFAWDRHTKRWFTPFSTVVNKIKFPWAGSNADNNKMLFDHKLREVRNVIASRGTESDISVPCREGLKFLPFQKAGIEYLLNKSNALLADQMGLGKTIQVIGLCNLFPSMYELHKHSVLIICPATLKLNWLREWMKWSTLFLSVDVAYGKHYPKSDVVIINYDILARHHKAIHDKVWDLVVIDEAHYLKNNKANRTKQVVGYRALPAVKARRKLALTGTPIVNRPVELFNIIKYLAPYAWWDKMRYARRYCAAFRGPWGWDMSGASNLAEFQEKLRSTIMIRRLKKDVLPQLPPKRHQVIEIQPDAKTAKLLKTELAFTGMPLDVLSHREQMIKWAVRNATKIGFGEMSTIRREVAEAKIPYVIKHLEDAVASSGKVICFCHHKMVAARLKTHFSNCCVVLTGDTPSERRQGIIDRFQEDQQCKLFIGNIQAAGVGINLTAASHVVFAEISWVPGEIEQCEDRCHRIGTTGSVLIQFLVMASSIDAAIAMTYIEKQGIIEKAIDAKPSEDLGIMDLLK